MARSSPKEDRRAAIGFYFGGGNVLELARDGADIAAALLALDGHDHFSILEELASPSGRLTSQLAHLVRDKTG